MYTERNTGGQHNDNFQELQKPARIQNQNDLIDAHIAICQAYSAYRLTHKQFDELRDAMILKRLEKKIAWGQGI